MIPHDEYDYDCAVTAKQYECRVDISVEHTSFKGKTHFDVDGQT